MWLLPRKFIHFLSQLRDRLQYYKNIIKKKTKKKILKKLKNFLNRPNKTFVKCVGKYGRCFCIEDVCLKGDGKTRSNLKKHVKLCHFNWGKTKQICVK
ncbi:hypothetical protein BBP10_11020 [Limosilactobacillus reuteri]|nr:hypothetical protein BBP10_11020 [Limosilactobacillus reuteri]